MLISFFRLVARFRRPILVAEVVLAVTYSVLVTPGGSLPLPVTAALGLTGIALIVSTSGYRPATLVADPERRVFDTPSSPIGVFTFTCYLSFSFRSLAGLWPARGADDGVDPFDVLIVVLLVLLFAACWRERGVRLRPDGLLDRQPFGSLFVPWEALDPDRPIETAGGDSVIALTYRRPELIQRRGVLIFGSRNIRIMNVNRSFFTRVVRLYAAEPGRRSAIGSEAELRLLPQ